MRKNRTKMATDGLVALFTRIGLSEQKAKETIKNGGVAQNLKEVIEEVSIKVLRVIGVMLHEL